MLCVFENWMARFVRNGCCCFGAIWCRWCGKREQLLCSFVHICNGVCHRLTHPTKWPECLRHKSISCNDLECWHAVKAQKLNEMEQLKCIGWCWNERKAGATDTQMDSVFLTQSQLPLWMAHAKSFRALSWCTLPFNLRKHFFPSARRSLEKWRGKMRTASICAWVECVDLIKGLKRKSAWSALMPLCVW